MKSMPILLVASLCLCSYAGEENPEDRELPPRYFAAQTLDFFGAASVETVDEDGLADVNATSQDRNSVLFDAFANVSKRWMLAEKERVKLAKEKNRDPKQKPKARRFELNKPSYTSVQAYGPYATQAEADGKKAEAEEIIAQRAELAIKREASKLRLMSMRVKKTYEARQALIDEQQELFLTEVSTLQDRVRITRIANGSKNVKRISKGRITKLVKNPRRIVGPDISNANATKVDQRGVQNR